MNFCGFSFDSETRGQVSRLAQSGRLPHAVIIESKSEEQAKNLAALLSAYAVCESEDKPCGVCRQCKNALSNAHPDIKKLEPDKKSKSGIYSIEQIRDLAVDAQVRPNDADAKVLFPVARQEREGSAADDPLALHGYQNRRRGSDKR